MHVGTAGEQGRDHVLAVIAQIARHFEWRPAVAVEAVDVCLAVDDERVNQGNVRRGIVRIRTADDLVQRPLRERKLCVVFDEEAHLFIRLAGRRRRVGVGAAFEERFDNLRAVHAVGRADCRVQHRLPREELALRPVVVDKSLGAIPLVHVGHVGGRHPVLGLHPVRVADCRSAQARLGQCAHRPAVRILARVADGVEPVLRAQVDLGAVRTQKAHEPLVTGAVRHQHHAHGAQINIGGVRSKWLWT